MKEQLTRIYNSLSLITTRGEDTIIMAQCLITLRELVLQLEDKKEE